MISSPSNVPSIFKIEFAWDYPVNEDNTIRLVFPDTTDKKYISLSFMVCTNVQICT